MNTNHDFQIGDSHTVCQDFAMSGEINTIHYAIICDGCSSSPDTDFGARIMAFAARQRFIDGGYKTYECFAFGTLDDAMRCAAPYYLHPHTMDVTLLVAFVVGGIATVYMYGDGITYFKRGDKVNLIHVSYELMDGETKKTAPDYLSYRMNMEREANYRNARPTKIIQRNGMERRVDPFTPVTFQMAVEPGDIIGISSDGIDSFRQPNGDVIPWQEIAKEFFGFKQTNGVFVNRRMSAFQRKCVKDNVTHYDDISVAAIVV